MKTKILLATLAVLMIAGGGCKKKSTTDDTIYNTASCKANGTSISFKTTSNFTKFCIMTGVCNNFYAAIPVMVGIGFPADAAAGKTYTNKDSWVQLTYMDSQGRGFYSRSSDTVNIHISTWGGSGGYATGTFSGKVYYSTTVPPYSIDSVSITDGVFNSLIWFAVQK
jgi:hypothetical protein